MEPILDETSLVPCPEWPPGERLRGLARTLSAFDDLGAPRVLRAVRDAPDRDIGGGLGLRQWCFDRATDRDAGRLVASRLGKLAAIDGPGGLYALAEGDGVVEARAGEAAVQGLGLAALVDGLVAALGRAAAPAGGPVAVSLAILDDAGERAETLELQRFVLPAEVEAQRAVLQERVDRSVRDGGDLVRRVAELYPRLRLGPRAAQQLGELRGSETVFRQLLRHLRALDRAAAAWSPGAPFEPGGITFSVESQATLSDGALGPLRDFPPPAGFEPRRWSLHTKLTGGAGARLYFRPEATDRGPVVLVGYFGEHLPTALHRT